MFEKAIIFWYSKLPLNIQEYIVKKTNFIYELDRKQWGRGGLEKPIIYTSKIKQWSTRKYCWFDGLKCAAETEFKIDNVNKYLFEEWIYKNHFPNDVKDITEILIYPPQIKEEIFRVCHSSQKEFLKKI